VECQEDTDCDDGKAFTKDQCSQNICVNTFIEGYDCGSMNFSGFEGSQAVGNCFGTAMLDCIPARTRIVGDNNVIFTIMEQNGDKCKVNYLLEDSPSQDVPGEGLDAECLYSLSYINSEYQEGMEAMLVLYLVFVTGGLGQPGDTCQGDLIDFSNTPCSEHCTTEGFSFSKCLLPSDSSTYKICSIGEAGYIGKIASCQAGTSYGTCCCANSEEEMLK
jgi:hypothetical protein